MKKFNLIWFILLVSVLTGHWPLDTGHCSAAEQQKLWLVYSVGIGDGAEPADGVIFKVEIGEPGKKGSLVGEDEWTEIAWKACRIDMSKFRDKKIALKFITDPGATTVFDWACWGDIYIIEGDLPKEFDGVMPVSAKILFDFQKLKPARTGYINDEEDVSPNDPAVTGSTFEATSRSCGTSQKKGYFAHPGWQGDAAGCPSFGEFVIDMAKPGQVAAPMSTYEVDKVKVKAGAAEEKGKAIAVYGFEPGEPEEYIIAFGAEISNDPKNVIAGKSSLFCTTVEQEREWFEFFHSDPVNLQFKAKGTYTVVFNYKVTEKKGDCTFYFLARTATPGPGPSDKGWIDIKDPAGKTGTMLSTFTLDDFDDYFLVIGVRFQGAIAVDDIRVFPGKITQKDLGIIASGKELPKVEAVKKTGEKAEEFVDDEEPDYEIKEGVIYPRISDFKYLGKSQFSVTYEWLVKEKIEEDYTVFIHYTNADYGENDREDIAFQGDHAPATPVSSWKEKSTFIDGPFNVGVPEKCGAGVYYIQLGLYNEKGRFPELGGATSGSDKIVLGKLIISGTPGRIKDIKFRKLKSMQGAAATPFPPLANIFPLGTAPVFKIPKSLKIDGDISDWPQEITGAPLCIGEKKQLTIEDEEWKGVMDLGSTFYLGYDKDNLYLAEVRSDDSLNFQDKQSRDFFQSDYTRIYISNNGPKGPTPGNEPKGSTPGPTPGKDDYLFAIIPEGDGLKPMVKLQSYNGFDHKDYNYRLVETAAKMFDNGWIMEVKIPFASMGITPQAGQSLGFQLIIGDTDKPGKRIHEMAWKPAPNSADYWFNPQTFGKLTFCDNAFAWASPDKDLYIPGETPKAMIGVYTVKPGGDLSGDITLKDRAGNVIDKQAVAEKVDAAEKHIVKDMASLKSEGEYTLESSLKYQDQVFTGTAYAKAFAIRMRERKSLLALAAPAVPTIIPSVDAVKYLNSARQDSGKYVFEYKGEDNTISYEVIPGLTLNVAVLVNGVTLFKSEPAYTGPQISIGNKNYSTAKLSPKILNAKLENNKLTYNCEAACENENIKIAYAFSVQGKSLLIDVSSSQALFNSFKGPLAGIPAKQVMVPYMNWIPVYYTNNYFVSGYYDWTKTGCSWFDPYAGPGAIYSQKTDRTRNPLKESLYIAVSDDLLEVLPNMPNPRTPYMDVLGSRVMLDWWTGDQYKDSAKYLETLKGYGIDNLVIIYHVWQRWGYDVKLPSHYPADPRMGGDEGMKILGVTAKNLGYVLSLHENYIDYYPDYSEYTEEAVAVDQNKNRINAWYQPGTKIQSFRMKPTWIEKYARQESPLINKAYQTKAAYLDVQPTGAPWQLDFDAKEEGAASFKYVFDKLTWLYNFERETHGGPIFGEGNQHAFWAGRVDGCEAQIANGQFCPVLVDFDLLKVHPLMVNHGMGYYSRWYELQGQVDRRWTELEIEKYRGQELAYGHAGFIDTSFHKNLTQTLREYYLTQPMMARYAPFLAEKIQYMLGDKWVNSNTASRIDASRKVNVKYTSGLELWINNENEWKVEGYTLPPYGFLGKGAGALAATALFNGKLGDYSETPEWIFADPRTYETMHAEATLIIEPQLSELTYLGERKFKIKYRWVAGEPGDIDYACFVHFTDEGGKILYQNDHQLPSRSSKWVKGQTVEDGPYTVVVPDEFDLDSYDIRVGLWDPTTGRRAVMKGANDGENRYIIGKIIADQKDGQITNLKATVAKESKGVFASKNLPGTVVDFGTLATDATLRINKEKAALTVLPIPHGQKFNLCLRVKKILGDSAKVTKVTVLDKDKKELGKVEFKDNAGEISFAGTYPDAWYYRVE